MTLTTAQFEQQKKQVEELIAGPESLGFVKALFFGHFRGDLLFPYPELPPGQRETVNQAVAKVRRFAEEHIDPFAIDRNADIPEHVVRGLSELGVLGMTAPPEYGGLGFTQEMYCKVMEAIGGHDAATAVFVNAHHSIGIRALILFGTPEQKQRWLPDLVAGRKLGAFALTEPQAGSDAGNVQTRATPTEDGSSYVLNGEKRYITNAAIAQVLTVMARTPAPTPADPNATRVTAFLVTPDMPGFEVVEARAEKCGIRGTATGRLRFTNMRVPKENVLGQVGKGLKVALTVLDFGRTTFGASCTGVAKACVKAAVRHAKSRVQFQQPLAEFELVKKKIAFMAAHAFAMEAATTQCAAFIDRGHEDYMLETAILKVFATEHLWTIVNDTIQVFGGQAYFCNEPYERWMRDARINLIGEGANEVLKAFVAVVGSRGPGEPLKKTYDYFKAHPIRGLPGLLRMGAGLMWRSTPHVPARSPELRREARTLAGLVKRFGAKLPWVFKRAGTEEAFAQSQLQHERIADIAMDLYVGACTLSRLDSLLLKGPGNGDAAEHNGEVAAGRDFLAIAFRRIRQNFAALDHNDDPVTVAAANATLARF